MNEQENNVMEQNPMQENIQDIPDTQNTNLADNPVSNEPSKYNLGPIEEPIEKKNNIPLIIQARIPTIK